MCVVVCIGAQFTSSSVSPADIHACSLHVAMCVTECPNHGLHCGSGVAEVTAICVWACCPCLAELQVTPSLVKFQDGLLVCYPHAEKG